MVKGRVESPCGDLNISTTVVPQGQPALLFCVLAWPFMWLYVTGLILAYCKLGYLCFSRLRCLFPSV